MSGELRGIIERAMRVRKFSRAHPFADPAQASLVIRLDELIARIEVLEVEERAGRAEAAAAARELKRRRRALHRTLAGFLAAVEVVAAREGDPGFDSAPAPAVTAGHASFLARCWEILDRARTDRAHLLRLGLAPGWLDDLTAMVNGFEAAAVAAEAGRRDRAATRTERERARAELGVVFAWLDRLNRGRFGEGPLLEAWVGVLTDPTPPDLGRAA